MASTYYLSLLLGAYMVAAGIGIAANPARWSGLIDELERSPVLLYVIAIVAFMAGGLIIGFHCSWDGPLAIAITLIGWAALIEGLVLLAVPAIWFALARPFMSRLRPFAFIVILLGLALLAAGLSRHFA